MRRFVILKVVLCLLALPVHAADIVSKRELLEALVPITGDALGAAERSIDLDIQFELGSATLTDKAYLQIEALSEALNADTLASASFGIYGHTDASGAAHFNQNLSEQRAWAVYRALERFSPLDIERFDVRGFGENRLKNTLDPVSSDNRRVEIIAIHHGSGEEGDDNTQSFSVIN